MDGIGNWRKSTYSSANGGECVELASGQDAVLVRDTTNRDGLTLSVAAGTWTAFLNTLR
jgi:hypothetical protein